MARAGVRVTYLFGDDESPAPPPAPVQEAAPVVIPPEAPYVLMDVVGTNEEGRTESVSEIVLSEVTSVDVVPLLPNVFFDSTSATMPARYRDRSGSTAAFLPNEIEGDILNVYHDILNITGYRLQQRSSATLTVKGHVEPASGESDAALAQRRAEAVRDYLVRVWKIDASRITVTSAMLPAHPSNRSIADGREENRRVELSSNDLAVLAPVRRVSKRARLIPDPISVLPKVEPANVSVVKITSSDGRVVASEQVASASTMTWRPRTGEIAALLNAGQRRLVVAASSGEGEQYREARHVIGLRRSTASDGDAEADTIRERHRLVFFDFDDDKISATDAPYMEALQARLRTTSKITVTGYTDRIGDRSYNTSLATRRASRVAETIKERIVPEQVVERGAGPELIHNNDLPEGRMYNRTVVIDVATPRAALQGEE
jgi:outer membrane protein OmpA-like peptidoglycan-associated protein